MQIRLRAGILAICGLIGAIQANNACAAPTINAKLDGVGLSQGGVTVTHNAVGHPSNGGGRFDWTVLSNPDNLTFRSPTGGESQSKFVSFCIELTQTVSPGSSYTGLSVNALSNSPQPGSIGAMGPQAAALLANMWYQHITTSASKLPLTNATQAAAFQIAIWEIVYDGAGVLDLGNGNVTATGNASLLAAAQTFLNSANANGAKANLYAISKGPGSNFQDQVIELVPEPASVIAWSLIGCCFVAGAKLRRGKVS